MIGIVIGWLIAGVILVIFSILMYYYNILQLFGFLAILLLGIIILLASTILIIERQSKRMLGKPFSEEMKSKFIILTAVSIIIFVVGAIGYLITTSGYSSNISLINTLLSILTSNSILKLAIGVLGAAGGIFSWIYSDRYGITSVSKEISQQHQKLENIKAVMEKDRTKIKSNMDNLNKLIEDAKKIENKANEELAG